MPKVSVLIPAYNSADFLPQAVESVLAQSFQDYEIVIVDDGSTDQTAALAQEFARRNGGRIRYIHQENQGVSAARNALVQQAQGELVSFLDADDYWAPNHLNLGVQILNDDAKTGLVHSNITRVNPKGELIEVPVRETQYLSGRIFEPLFLRQAHIACSTVIMRKACFQRVGWFDLNLTRLGCEDRDMWLRLAREYKITYVDEPSVFYRMGLSSLSQNSENMLKARLYIVDKYSPYTGHSPLRSKALAKIYRDHGDEFLLRGNSRQARQDYGQALRYNPLEPWTWINWVKAWLKK